MSRKRLITTALVLGLLALTAAMAFFAVDPGEIAAAFSGVSPAWLAAAAVAYGLGQIASGLSWHRCLRAAKLNVGARQTMMAYWIGRGIGELLPGQLGEGVKLWVLRRHPEAHTAGWMKTAGSIGSFKMVESIATFVVITVLIAALAPPGPLGELRWAAVAALVLTAIFAPFLWRLNGPARRLGRRLPSRVAKHIKAFVSGGNVFATPMQAVSATALAVFGVAAKVVFFLALLAAFGIPISATPLVFCLVMAASLLPVLPGGLGVREAAMVPALVAAYGLALESGLAFSLGVQATILLVCASGGIMALTLLGLAKAREVAPAVIGRVSRVG